MTSKKELDNAVVNDENATTPKKRTRIVKKDTGRVYSASQIQGERFDTVQEEMEHKRAAVSKAKDEKAAAIHALESEVLVPPRKNRGRPSKAYLEAQRAYEEALARQQSNIDAARSALNGDVVGIAIDTVAEQTVTEQTDNVVEEDIPEFILMQQQAAAANALLAEDDQEITSSESVEEEDVTVTDENIIREDDAAENAADAPAVVDNTPETPSPLMQRLTEAYKAGQRFIIEEDIPTLPTDDFIFDVVATDSTPDFYETPSTERSSGANDVHEATASPEAQLGEILIEAEGVVELDAQGVGYLRSADYNYMPSPDDVFISQQIVRNNTLKTGDLVNCQVRVPKEGEKYYNLVHVNSINGRAPREVRDRMAFEHLTPLFPDEQYRLSKRGYTAPLSCRIVDLFAPIGKGQRALIVAQPKTGKTILMKQIANAIAANYPDTYLMMLLIDERPEEVTDMARTVNAEVIASTFDEPAKRHVRIANLVLEKAKRMVECGRDVVIFLDSITRLARAFNTEAPASGKILSGGVDANALQKPKRFFGAARNIEGGGSLTIIATALIDTGSRMDEVIFEEFKGTGNMELQLDRTLANKRIFPAVNLVQSSTRREDLLLDEETINRMFITRNFMADMSPVEAMNFIKKHLESTVSNEEFIATINS